MASNLKRAFKWCDHLVKALNDHGITEIKADGETFDPTLHQAVQTVLAEEGRSLKLLLMFFKQDINSKTGTQTMVVVAQQICERRK